MHSLSCEGDYMKALCIYKLPYTSNEVWNVAEQCNTPIFTCIMTTYFNDCVL